MFDAVSLATWGHARNSDGRGRESPGRWDTGCYPQSQATPGDQRARATPGARWCAEVRAGHLQGRVQRSGGGSPLGTWGTSRRTLANSLNGPKVPGRGPRGVGGAGRASPTLSPPWTCGRQVPQRVTWERSVTDTRLGGVGGQGGWPHNTQREAALLSKAVPLPSRQHYPAPASATASP